MGRVVAGVIAGYVVMLAVIFVGSTLAWMALGPNGAFLPGTYQTTMIWVGISLAVSLFAAVLGGFACAAVSRRDPRATRGLVGLVVVLGVLFAVPVLMRAPDGAERPDVVTMQAAMQHARQPVWVALLLPLLGAAGAVLGAGMRKRASIT